MSSKRSTSLMAVFIAMSMLVSLFPMMALAAAGDNLWISDTQWGQLIDPTGSPVILRGAQLTIPVTLTSAQGTILVTTPGAGTTDDEKSAPQLDGVTGLYKNVVYIDSVNAPTTGSVYNYTIGFDSALVTKGQKLYVKVGGTSTPAGDHQKATTTYLGAEMPSGSFTATNISDDLVINTPSAVWTNPTVSVTISEGGLTKDISGLSITESSITVSNSALKAAFTEVSGSLTVTGIIIKDSIIEDIFLTSQNIAISFTSGPATAPNVSADDINNIIVGLDLGTMEYAISTDDGDTYGNYTSDPEPFLGGSKKAKVRVKAAGGNPAGFDTTLTFTINKGDVNGDGLINISDVIMVAEIAVGYTGYTPEQKIRANISDKVDMTIDISDVVLIIERSIGGTNAFPVDLP